MPLRVFLLLTAVIVLAPSRPFASEISLVNRPDRSGETLVFGSGTPAQGSLSYMGVLVDEVPLIEPDEFRELGTIGFVSNVLLSHTIDIDPETGEAIGADYEYGLGVFRVTANWETQDGLIVKGGFVSTMLGISIDTCEKCTEPLPQNYGRFVATLGAGIFDSALADFLGVPRRTLGGMVTGDVDDISGDPTSVSRLAGAPGAWTVAIVSRSKTVPEPGTAILLSTAAGFAVWRRSKRAR